MQHFPISKHEQVVCARCGQTGARLFAERECQAPLTEVEQQQHELLTKCAEALDALEKWDRWWGGHDDDAWRLAEEVQRLLSRAGYRPKPQVL